jgi:hypothetical protein
MPTQTKIQDSYCFAPSAIQASPNDILTNKKSQTSY